MYTKTKENNLFDIFLKEHKNVNPKESIYIDDRKHILDKAKTYDFHLLLMDKKNLHRK